MSNPHPLRYLVKARRHNTVVHVEEAATPEQARRMALRFEAVPHTEAEVIEVPDPADADLTAHTRKIVERIAAQARS